MIQITSFFVILGISLIIVRIAAIMLTMTGMSEDAARFQARSAFTGTGFTTGESETITGHPVRRKIIANLMLIGNIGFVTIVTSLILSFLGTESREEFLIRIGVLSAGLFVFMLLTKSKLFNRVLKSMVKFLLKKWTRVYAKDYDSLLNLSGEFEVINVKISDESWMADSTIESLRMNDEGVLILGIKRPDGYYTGTPRGETVIYPGDQVILYGRESILRNIGDRPKGEEGDRQHREEAEKQRKIAGRTTDTPGEKGKKPLLKKVAGLFSRKKSGG